MKACSLACSKYLSWLALLLTWPCFVRFIGFSVTRFQPAVARPEGGATITIFGRGFATPFRGLVFEVAIDDQACRRVQVESDGELTCTAPPGSGVRLKVTVTPIVQVSYGGGQSPLTYDMKLAPLTLSGFAYTGAVLGYIGLTFVEKSFSISAGKVDLTWHLPTLQLTPVNKL